MNFDAPLISLCFGVVLLSLYLWIWLSPSKAFSVLKRFPRTTCPARILMAVSLVWFAMNLNQVDLGRFNVFKIGLWVLMPVTFYLIITLLSDLLAVRGLCTFGLLAGQSILTAVRWHGSAAHIAVALLVYLLMVKCMFLIVYPHFWIRGFTWLEDHPKQKKSAIIAGTGVSSVLIVVGILSF